MPLKLIHGPPNSGRAGEILRLFREAAADGPVLVVPTFDDVVAFERELSREDAVLGGSVMTFDGLFAAAATAAGAPPSRRLSQAQRLRLVGAAVGQRRPGLGPLRRSAERTGFAPSLDRFFGELQAAGLDPAAIHSADATLAGSAYLTDLTDLFAAYEEARARTGRIDSHGVARQAIARLAEQPGAWGRKPVFVYGVDDLTRNQLELIRRLSDAAEVTMALTHEEGREALEARSGLADLLREEIGVAAETATAPEPANTDTPLLFHLERGFADSDAARLEPREGLAFLRSAGERGEAEAIAATVGRLLHDGAEPEQVAVVLRDPAARGPLIARVMESYGIGVALEAELPVASTGVGGAVLALAEAEFGTGRATDVMRWLRGPSGAPSGRVDWLERSIRRRRVQTAAEALALWSEEEDELPYDLRKLRDAPSAGLVSAIGETATRMAMRFLDGDGDGPPPGPGDGTELQAAATISGALAELAELGPMAPGPEELIGLLREMRFRAWIGPIEGRVRIADPMRLRAGRFDHVVVGSLQDGEFPRRRGGDPFLSEEQREALGLDPRRDDEAEERYLFYTCLSLPRRSLVLSYRDSDEAGAAEARSPFIDDVRRLLSPPPGADADPVEASLTRTRSLAEAVHPAWEAPSEDELARALAARAGGPDAGAALAAAAPGPEVGSRVEARLAGARRAEEETREPGPLTGEAVIAALREVPAYGGTTLERFDECSYRWFADHELSPEPLDPLPDAIVQGSLMHEALERLYGERPGGTPRPSAESLPAWIERGAALVTELADETGLGERPVERAIRRRVDRLLSRFLAEEAARAGGAFEPALLEAGFDDAEDSDRPALTIDGWRLHGKIDRVDLSADGRALVHDYKVASSATPAKKLEEDAKLQLQLYLIAVGKHWGATPIGALYHPLRGTSDRRPRGLVVEEEAEDFAPYDLVGKDLLDPDEFEQALEEARSRATRIVARMRDGDIRRDPGPRKELKGHDVCPTWCDFAPICRRDRSPVVEEEREAEER